MGHNPLDIEKEILVREWDLFCTYVFNLIGSGQFKSTGSFIISMDNETATTMIRQFRESEWWKMMEDRNNGA